MIAMNTSLLLIILFIPCFSPVRKPVKNKAKVFPGVQGFGCPENTTPINLPSHKTANDLIVPFNHLIKSFFGGCRGAIFSKKVPLPAGGQYVVSRLFPVLAGGQCVVSRLFPVPVGK